MRTEPDVVAQQGCPEISAPSQGKKRMAPPSAEEIDEARKRKKLLTESLPEGMLMNAWKRLQRDKKWEETKAGYRQVKKDKKRTAILKKRETRDALIAAAAGGDKQAAEEYKQLRKSRELPETQQPSNVKVIIDCEFDELMSSKEIVSLSNQVTRSYSAKRHCEYDLPLRISSFNKSLKSRFDKSVTQYHQWQGINFSTNDTLKELLPSDPKELQKFVYLTADTDEIIQDLEPDHTYIIGGIVDRNRYKKLCVNKAKELGIRVGKLPIDKYIEINGRQVLATSHVYELCCKWFELGKDWEKAFNDVLPARKVKGIKGDAEDGDEVDEEHGDENEDEK